MRSQLDICNQLNKSLVTQTREVETSIGEMEHNLKPVTIMWDTVSQSNENITRAMEQIEQVHAKVAAINAVIATLQQRH